MPTVAVQIGQLKIYFNIIIIFLNLENLPAKAYLGPMTQSLDLPPTLSVLFLFRHMSDQVGARISAMRPDLTPNDISLLLHLNAPRRMKELAEMMTCLPSNVTPLVTRAEARGWVRKDRSATDARAVDVTLTEAGQNLRAEVIALISAEVQAVTGLTEAQALRVLEVMQAEAASTAAQ